MTPVRQCAAALSAIAAFGLAVAPVLHAELHVRAAENARRSAVERLFELAFQKERGQGHREQLAAAAEDAFGSGGERAGAIHHHHPGKGAHGDGAPEHLTLAFRSAPPPPPLPQRPRVEAPTPARPASEHLLERYLVPSFSQGPPRA